MAQLWNGMSETLLVSLMQSSIEGSNCLGQVETSLKTTEHLSLLFTMCLLHGSVISVYSPTACVLLAKDPFFLPLPPNYCCCLGGNSSRCCLGVAMTKPHLVCLSVLH